MPLPDNRTLPNSLEAEQSILGCVLVSEDCAMLALEKLKESDFYSPIHRRIWNAMFELARSSKPIDFVTVTERLEAEQSLTTEELSYIANLSDTVPSLHNLGSYIEIVHEKNLLRQTLEACAKIRDKCYDQNLTAQDVLNYASDVMYGISSDKGDRALEHIRYALMESFNNISKAAKAKNGILGVTTGFPLMDRTLAGFQPSQLIVIAGKTGMGKTSFALNIAEHIGVTLKKTIAIFSLEMSRDQLSTRILCGKSQVDSQSVRTGNIKESELDDIVEAMTQIGESQIYIDDTPTLTPMEVLTKSRRLKQKRGELSVVIIDYLQLMQAGRKTENRQLEIAYITRTLKQVARELEVPVVILSQLKRVGDARENKAPMLSDLKESGSIEQDADVVLFLHRDDYQKTDDNAELTGKSRIIIAKQRSGPIGNIQVKWRGELTKYMEVSSELEEGAGDSDNA